MKIGAVITHFNAASTVERTILSALNQQVPFDKILLVDDHSNINEFEKVSSICAKYSNVGLVRNSSNKGYAYSLNKGVDQLDCEYIFILDDDDESLPWRTQKQLELLLQGADFVYSSRLVNKNGLITLNKTVDFNFMHPIEKGVPELLFSGRYRNQNMLGEFGSCTLAFRKENFIQLNGFDPQFRRKAEWDFIIRCALAKNQITSVQMPCIVQHKTEGHNAEKGIIISTQVDNLLLSKHRDVLRKCGIFFLAKAYLYTNRQKYYSRQISFLSSYIVLRFLRLGIYIKRLVLLSYE